MSVKSQASRRQVTFKSKNHSKSTVLGRRSMLLAAVGAVAAATFPGRSGYAALDTWAGNNSNSWSNNGNWANNNTPGSNDSVIFGAAGTSGTTLVDDVTGGTASFTMANVTYNAGSPAFTINQGSGTSGFTLSGGITNSGNSLQTINDAILLSSGATHTITMTAFGGNINLAGTVGGSGTLNLGGFGSLILSGSNNFAGGTLNFTQANETLVVNNVHALDGLNTASITASQNCAIDLATNGGEATPNLGFSSTSGVTIYSDRATAGAAINHTVGVGTYGGGSLSVAAGSNVTSGTPTITFGTFMMTSGGVNQFYLYPTTANMTLNNVGIANVSKNMFLDGFSQGNVIQGTIGGANGQGIQIIKGGTSTWTITGASSNNFGPTIVAGGTLQVGNGISGNLTTTGVGAQVQLAGSATLKFQGITTGSSTSVGTLTFSAGDGVVQSNYGGTSGSTSLTFAGSAAVRSAGATGNFVPVGGTNGTSNFMRLATAPTAGSMLNVGEFFNGNSFATYDSNGFIRAYASTDTSAATAAGANGITPSVTSNVFQTADVTSQGSGSINTLNMGSFNLTLAGGSTFATNSILQSAGTSTFSGGTSVQSGTLNNELVVRVNGVSDQLTIATPIVNSTGFNSALTKSGMGTLVLSGTETYTGTTFVNGGTLVFSGSAASMGAITVNGTGNLNVTGTITGGSSTLSVANTPGNSVLNIGNGAVLTRSNLNVGVTGGAVGAVYQSGGVVTINAAAATTDMQLGSGIYGYGYYGMTGGTLTSNQIGIGGNALSGSGLMEVTNATVTDAGSLTLANGTSGPNMGELNLFAGASVSYANGIVANAQSNGELSVINVLGGKLINTNDASINLNSAGSSSNRGILTLAGGTAQASAIAGTNGIVNFNGGTLTAFKTNTGTFLGNTGGVYVYSGGGTINNNGFALSFSNNLLAPTGNGVTTISLSSGGSGYVAPPLVQIVGGGGTGATAYATVSGGVITGIVVTNPGVGYTSTPTVVLVANGNNATATPAAVSSVTTGANAATGGFAFLGSGTVTYSGAGSYTGLTSVTNGNLVLSGTGQLNTSSGITVTGVGSKFVDTSSVTVTPNITINQGGIDGTGTASGKVSLVGGTNFANGNGGTSSFTIGTLSISGPSAGSIRIAGGAGTTLTGINVTNSFTTPGSGLGSIVLSVTAPANSLLPTTYDLIKYGTFSGLASDFSIGTVTGLTGRESAGSIINDTANSAIAITISGLAGSNAWTGAGTVNTWANGAVTNNWNFSGGGAAPHDYFDGDTVIFDDTATGTTTVNISAANVTPASVTFNNSSKAYTITGPFGITGTTGVAFNGPGMVSLNTSNSYTGPTTISGGTVNLGGTIGTSSLTFSSGTLNVTGSYNAGSVAGVGGIPVGSGTNSNALMTISGSGLVNATNTGVSMTLGGGNPNAAGALHMSGGTLNENGQMWLATADGQFGAFSLSGGVATVNSWLAVSRGGGQGVLNVSGGTLNINNATLTIGSIPGGDFSDIHGLADFSGGVTNVGTQIYVGELNHGVMNVRGNAQVNVAGANGVLLTSSGGTLSYGQLNLDGGTLTAAKISQGNVNLLGQLNLEGGTLKANAAGTLISPLTFSAYVYPGTSTINNGGLGVSITAQLLDPGSGGSQGISASGLSFSGGGFIDTPIVMVDGGGGSDATASAIIDANGNLTGITITNPGHGYSSSPTFRLLGGGNGNTGTITGNAALVNVSGGNLTFTGTGTTSLTADNQYSGQTNVAGGVVVLSGSGDVNGSSTITVNGGKLLQLSSTKVNPPIVVSSGTLDGTTSVSSVSVGSLGVVANGNGTVGSFSIDSLTLASGSKLSLNILGGSTSGNSALNTGTLALPGSGTVTVNLTPTSPYVSGTVYNLVSFSNSSGSPSVLTLGSGLSPRDISAGSTLSISGNEVVLTYNGDTPVWSGVGGGTWSTAASGNNTGPNSWALLGAHTATNFWVSDNVQFNDTYNLGGTFTAPATTAVLTPSNVSPLSAIFNNSSVNYTISGAGGIASGYLTKGGNGSLVLANSNSYTGTTTVNGGTLLLDYTAAGVPVGNMISSTSPLVLGGGAVRINAKAAGNTTQSFAGTTINSGGSSVVVSGDGTSAPGVLNLGSITHNSGSAVTFTAPTGTQSATNGILTNTAVTNGILGPWGVLAGTGTAAAGSANGYTYATTNGATGNVVAYTGATNAGTFNNIGGGTGSSVTNYDVNVGSNSALFNSRVANTIRWTGGVGSQAFSGILTTNGLLNSGTGVFTLNGGGTLTAGTNNNNDMVLVAASAPMVISDALGESTGGSTVTILGIGSNSVTLTGGSSYTGPTVLAGGSLILSGTGSINSSTGITLNGNGAKLVQLSSTAGTIPVTIKNGSIDGTGTLGSVTVANSAGNSINNGNGSSGTLTLSNLTFQGAATVNVNVVPGAVPIAVQGSLSTSPSFGKVVINVNGSYNFGAVNDLIADSSFSGNISDFTLGTVANLGPRGGAATLVQDGNNIALSLSTLNALVWNGNSGATWTTAAQGDGTSGTQYWNLSSTLAATNFWAGDVVQFRDTTASGGSVGTTTVSINATNVSPGSVNFANNSLTYTLASSGSFGITGSTGLSMTGSGTLIVTNSNSYSGATSIGSSAKLKIGDGTPGHDGTLGTSAVANSGQLIFAPSTSSVTFSNTISGTGSVTIAGPGQQVLTANNTYSGGTNINAGTLTIVNTAAFGGGTITINGGVLDENALVGTLSNAIAGSGGTIANNAGGTGTLAFTGNFNYGGNIVDYTGSTPGVLDVTFFGNRTFNFTGSMGLSGAVLVQGAGTLVTSSLPLAGTEIGFAGGGGSGALVYNGSTLTTNTPIFLQSAVAGASSALAYIDMSGTGLLRFSNANFFANPLAHTLTLQGSTSGVGELDGNIIDGLNSTATPTTLVKTGTGMWILGGSSTYSGTTTVNNGTLDVTGSLNGTPTLTLDASSNASALILDGANALGPTTNYVGLAGSGTPLLVVNNSQNFLSINTPGTTSFNAGSSTISTIDGVGTMNVASNASLTATSYLNHNVVNNSGTVSLTGAMPSNIGTLAGPGLYNVGATSTLNVTVAAVGSAAVNSAGTVNITAGASNVMSTVDGSGTLALSNAANLTATYIRQGNLSVGPGSTATIAYDSQAHTHGTPVGTSVVTTLSLNSGGTLDLTNNGIIVLDTTSLGAVKSLITQAADVSAGIPHWDMPGITSSTAATDHSHAIGYALASTLPGGGSTSFNGITFSDAVLARYTLVGDSSLKGTVDLSDYTKVVLNLGKSNASWSDGNFDYSGNVNLGDYTAVIRNLGRSDGQSAVFNATGPSAQQVKASALTLHSTPAVTQGTTSTDVTLLVNPTNGRVTLVNALQTGQAVITAYTINSPSQSLLPFSADGGGKYLANALENNPSVFYKASNGLTYNLWTGIKNVSTFIGEGFSNHYNANVDSTWTNYTLATSGYALGTLFKRLSSGGTKDLVFQWEDANLNTYTSVVTYVGAVPEPGSVSLVAMGAMAMLGRRRRRSAK